MVVLILPCAGKGSRLGLVYPKEIQGIGNDRINLDNTLDLAQKAGISKAVIITNKYKIRYFQDFIGYERNGISIDYFVNERYDSLPGSVLAGCQFAYYSLKEEKFIIGLPDTVLSNSDSYIDLLKDANYPILGLFDQPAEKYDAVYTNEDGSKILHTKVKQPYNEKYGEFQGTWGIIGLDIDTVNRLFGYLVQAEPFAEGDSYLLGNLIDKDCKNNKWFYKKINSDYIDLGTWKVFSQYLYDIWVKDNTQ